MVPGWCVPSESTPSTDPDFPPALMVIVPDVERFGEKNKTTDEQGWENVPPGTALEGLLLPQPAGKAYRLLKIVTQPATSEQLERLGAGRSPSTRS